MTTAEAQAESEGERRDPDTRPCSIPVHRGDLAGLRMNDVHVAICDDCGGPDSAGLLALDVLVAMGLELDISSQRLRAVRCSADPPSP